MAIHHGNWACPDGSDIRFATVEIDSVTFSIHIPDIYATSHSPFIVALFLLSDAVGEGRDLRSFVLRSSTASWSGVGGDG